MNIKEERVKWEDLTQGQKFITDLGSTNKLHEARYAVWIPGEAGRKGHRIAEISDNLNELCSKYQIASEFIFRICV